jgi:uncharacterized protein (DUF169 family)
MNFVELEGLFNSYLHLDKHVIGVTLFEDQKEFEELNVPSQKSKSFYCQMVKKAVNGKSVKADLSHFACETSAKILGLEPFYEEMEGIQGWLDSGLYASREQATLQYMSQTPVKKKTVGITVQPFSEITQHPDVVIIVCKPYQAMRLLQGYTYHHGYKNNFQLSGMCGVCFESTALPLTNQEITLSLLCSGTRFVCKWPEDLMMVSFPFDRMEKILDGVMLTAEKCEPNAYKVRIRHRLIHHNLPLNPTLNANKAYFYKNNA